MGRRATGTVEPLRTQIRLKFTWKGSRRIETLELNPTAANIKAAERLMVKVQTAIAAGVYNPADFFDRPGETVSETFAEVADRWIEGKTGAKSTLTGYKKSVRFWKNALAGKLVAAVRLSDLNKAVADKSKTVSGKTLNNHLIVLRGIFELALAEELIAKDPSEKVKQQPHQAPKPDPFDRDEMELMLAHIAKAYPEPVLNYYEFAFCTGLRPSEEIIARWSKVDWRKKTIHIDAASVLGVEKDTKTHTARDVDLSDRAIAVLMRQKRYTFMQGLDAPIFCNPNDLKPWHDEQRQRRAYWNPTLRALGIRWRKAYNTRHTYATLALMGDCNVLWVARQLGHVDAKMLLTVYAKWINGAANRSQADKLNEILSTNCPREQVAD